MAVGTKLIGALAFGLTTCLASSALAVGEDEASGSPKGLIGGALLGAEVVLCVGAAIDVEPTWWYAVGGGAGAVAGGVGGYYVDQDASARASMLMLAGGLTLAIPTVVAVLSATAYEPPADYLQDTAPLDEPIADPPQPDGAAPAPTPAPESTDLREHLRRHERAARREPLPKVSSRRLELRPPALLDVDPNRVALAIPAVEVRDVYTRAELFMFGVRQATEVRVPVLAVAF